MTTADAAAGAQDPARRPKALSPEASRRLDALRFPLVVAVIFIHNFGFAPRVGAGSPESAFVFDWFRGFISHGLARVAVPIFFIMSGYLLFLGMRQGWRPYLAVLRARVGTLLIPFLIWTCGIYLAFRALPALVPGLGALMSGQMAPPAASLWAHLDMMFGLTQFPVAVQFWFVRDLILLTALSPLLFLARGSAQAVLLAALAALWLGGLWALPTPQGEAVLFFAVGACAAMRGLDLFGLDRYAAQAGALFLAGAAAVGWATAAGADSDLIRRLSAPAGVIATLALSRRLAQGRTGAWMLSLAGCSFFVFAVHEPTQTLVRKLLQLSLPLHPLAQTWAVYLLPPLIATALALALFAALARLSPALARVLSGGRAAGRSAAARD